MEDQTVMEGSIGSAFDDLPALRLYSHSRLFYWWPVWLFGFIFAAISFFSGDRVRLNADGAEYIYDGSAMGIAYTTLILLVITFTTARLRGLYSVMAIMAITLLVSILGWFGLLDSFLELVPELSIHMNMGFYLFFSILLFFIWCLSFFIFDRTNYWIIRPGQMTEESMVGNAKNSYDTRGLLFEKRREDLFTNVVLGLGSGDLCLTTSGAKKEIIHIENVLFVDRKVEEIQKLLAVKP